MKLPLLLAQYLKEHQHLSLPGVGSFYANGPAATAESTTTPFPTNIRFEPTAVKVPDDNLIDFIKEKTGKIKPLAIADLTSYIDSGLEMLNIGRPFYIDGIGTIQKTREGKYDFVVRELTVIKQEEAANRKEESADKKKSVFDDEKYDTSSSNPLQKIMVAVLILGGLAIVVLGGYFLYNQKNGETSQQQVTPPLIDTTTQQQKDTLNIQADSSRSIASYAANTPGAFKFILETTKSKKRALKRYEQLKYTNVKMEAVDSTAYKLYYIIPAFVTDTARIKDSLSRYYASKVRIEYQ